MNLAIKHVDIDCHDPYQLAQFWSAALGLPVDPDNEPGDQEVAIMLPAENQPRLLLFLQVPDQKVVKNRLHLDLVPTNRTQQAEIDRLAGLGARIVDDRRGPMGFGFVVMADPEGNEFCIEMGPVERREKDALQQPG